MPELADLWYAILAFTVIGYVVLDGRNLGAAALAPWVSRDEVEQEALRRAIGPLWTWHEVWLLATGGVLFVAFPRVLATSLSGFYLAVFLLLWCFLGRGVALEVGEHLGDPLWRRFWRTILAVTSTLLAVLLGTTLGNLVRGVPIEPGVPFTLPLFTNFLTAPPHGILDWYTMSTAALGLIVLLAHGASYLATRTTEGLRARTRASALRLWAAAGFFLAGVTIATASVRPGLMAAIFGRPLGWLATSVVAAGCALLVVGARGARDTRLFLGSSLVLAGLLSGLAVGMHPVLLLSSIDASASLTTANAAAGEYGLVQAARWWPLALVLSLLYARFVGRFYRERIATGDARPEAGAAR